MRRDADGPLPEVGPWAEQKHDHLRSYATIFSTGMRKKWRTRVYVDLFTGAGKAIIEGTSRVVPSSALIVLGVKFPFDRYVFCEKDDGNLRALRARVMSTAPAADVRYVSGDCNARITDLLAELPSPGTRDALTFCFVDPFGVSDLKFETIRRLAQERRIDFLTLVPSHMDATRNEIRLTRANEPILDDFLGNRDWRSRWGAADREPAPPSFGVFVVQEFGRSMEGLGYQKSTPKEAAPVDARNRPIYHLAFFSKNPRGSDFWKKSKRSASKQGVLFED
jgi:three-Cys-motif partner protein